MTTNGTQDRRLHLVGGQLRYTKPQTHIDGGTGNFGVFLHVRLTVQVQQLVWQQAPHTF